MSVWALSYKESDVGVRNILQSLTYNMAEKQLIWRNYVTVTLCIAVRSVLLPVHENTGYTVRRILFSVPKDQMKFRQSIQWFAAGRDAQMQHLSQNEAIIDSWLRPRLLDRMR